MVSPQTATEEVLPSPVRAHNAGRLNVVLTCHYGRSGYNVLRSLNNVGAKVFVIRDARAISMQYSLRSKASCVVPQLDDADPEAIAHIINELHRKHGIDSVIGADVQSQNLILRMHDRLMCPVYPIASAETLSILNNKWTFYQLCCELGVPVPKSLLCADKSQIDPDLVGEALGWPVIVKPVAGYGQRGILILKDRDDFVARFLNDQSDQIMIMQEYLDGLDWGLGLFARNGHVEHWVAWFCPGQMDTNYGSGRFLATEFVDRPDLEEMGERIMAATNFSGIVNFDLRFDSRTETIRMLECNPRCFNRMLTARANGIDFVKPGLPGFAATQPRSLGKASFYPWQELLSLRGIKRLVQGRWPLVPLMRDVRDMIADPLVPVMRKALKEDARN